jgi:hypothetical protein
MKKVGIMSMQRIANYGLKKLIEELDCKVEFVDYHVGNPVIFREKNNNNKVIYKLQKGLEIFKIKAPIYQKLLYIRYKQNFHKKYMPVLPVTDKDHLSLLPCTKPP